ncbi:F-box protein At5g07610-like [Papaver somniferum]|uniref:F-box protein At5g07610-like n=1 Tax=Papaver somniferum TaxID=3469 RepID=UPI000E6FAE5E|nr:F-box protein At5g07610-like [Papaver somniferum]XP_026430480.1 F-box protein At5g07610-like [Papaver somniferum]
MVLHSSENQKINSEISSSLIAVISNPDLLRGVLLCLSVKSLLVFKSVSKQWCHLISDFDFIKEHLVHRRPSVPGFYLQQLSPWEDPEFEFIFLEGNIPSSLPLRTQADFSNGGLTVSGIEQSCNGLLLLCCYSSIDGKYYICNPSTKRYSVLPKDIKSSWELSICSVSLAFDPLKSPHYKVVCIWRNENDNFVIEIYCSRTASWRLSGNPVAAAPYDVFYKSGVFWNGSLHWMSTNCDSSNSSESSVYFDVDREQLRRMPVPPAPEKWYRRVVEYFGECKGKLHLIQNYLPSTTTSLDVLEMDVDYRCWTLKYYVTLDQLSIIHPHDIVDDQGLFKFSVLLIEEEKDSSKLVVLIQERVVSFDLKKFESKIIHGTIQRYPGSPWFKAHQYIESLAFV